MGDPSHHEHTATTNWADYPYPLPAESEGAVEAALGHYADGSADFADCLHAALALMAGEPPLWTFDKAAAKVDGARLLTA